MVSNLRHGYKSLASLVAERSFHHFRHIHSVFGDVRIFILCDLLQGANLSFGMFPPLEPVLIENETVYVVEAIISAGDGVYTFSRRDLTAKNV